jgi:hypothetical protein
MPIVSTPGLIPGAARGAARAMEPWYGELPEQALGVVGGAFRFLDTPGRYTRSGVNYLTGGGWNPETTGWDLLERMTGVKNKPGFFGQWAGAYDLLAFAIEVGLDPLTFLGGIGAGAKSAASGAKVAKLEFNAITKGAVYSKAKQELKGLATDYNLLKAGSKRKPTASDFYVRPKATTVTGELERVPFGPLDPKVQREAMERAAEKALSAEKAGLGVGRQAKTSDESLEFMRQELAKKSLDLRNAGDDIAMDLSNAVQERRMLESAGKLGVLRTEAPSLKSVKLGIGGTDDILYRSRDGKLVGPNFRAVLWHDMETGKISKSLTKKEILSITEKEAIEVGGLKRIQGSGNIVAQLGEKGIYKGGPRQILKELDETPMDRLHRTLGNTAEYYKALSPYKLARETGRLSDADTFAKKIPLIGRFFRGQAGREAWMAEKIASGEIIRPNSMAAIGLPRLHAPTVNTPGRLLSHVGSLVPLAPGLRKASGRFLQMTEDLRKPFWADPKLQINLFHMIDKLDPMITKIPLVRNIFPGKIGSQVENALFRAVGALSYPLRATVYNLGGKKSVDILKQLFSTNKGPYFAYLRALKEASEHMSNRGTIGAQGFYEDLALEMAGLPDVVIGIAKRVGKHGDADAERKLIAAVHKSIKEGGDTKAVISKEVKASGINLTKEEMEKMANAEIADLVTLVEGTYGDVPLKAQLRNPYTGLVEDFSEKLTPHERLEDLLAAASKKRGVPVTHVDQLGPKVAALYERLTTELDGYGPETRGFARKLRNYMTFMSKVELHSGARPEGHWLKGLAAYYPRMFNSQVRELFNSEPELYKNFVNWITRKMKGSEPYMKFTRLRAENMKSFATDEPMLMDFLEYYGAFADEFYQSIVKIHPKWGRNLEGIPLFELDPSKAMGQRMLSHSLTEADALMMQAFLQTYAKPVAKATGAATLGEVGNVALNRIASGGRLSDLANAPNSWSEDFFPEVLHSVVGKGYETEAARMDSYLKGSPHVSDYKGRFWDSWGKAAEDMTTEGAEKLRMEGWPSVPNHIGDGTPEAAKAQAIPSVANFISMSDHHEQYYTSIMQSRLVKEGVIGEAQLSLIRSFMKEISPEAVQGMLKGRSMVWDILDDGHSMGHIARKTTHSLSGKSRPASVLALHRKMKNESIGYQMNVIFHEMAHQLWYSPHVKDTMKQLFASTTHAEIVRNGGLMNLVRTMIGEHGEQYGRSFTRDAKFNQQLKSFDSYASSNPSEAFAVLFSFSMQRKMMPAELASDPQFLALHSSVFRRLFGAVNRMRNNFRKAFKKHASVPQNMPDTATGQAKHVNPRTGLGEFGAERADETMPAGTETLKIDANTMAVANMVDSVFDWAMEHGDYVNTMWNSLKAAKYARQRDFTFNKTGELEINRRDLQEMLDKNLVYSKVGLNKTSLDPRDVDMRSLIFSEEGAGSGRAGVSRAVEKIDSDIASLQSEIFEIQKGGLRRSPTNLKGAMNISPLSFVAQESRFGRQIKKLEGDIVKLEAKKTKLSKVTPKAISEATGVSDIPVPPGLHQLTLKPEAADFLRRRMLRRGKGAAGIREYTERNLKPLLTAAGKAHEDAVRAGGIPGEPLDLDRFIHKITHDSFGTEEGLVRSGTWDDPHYMNLTKTFGQKSWKTGVTKGGRQTQKVVPESARETKESLTQVEAVRQGWKTATTRNAVDVKHLSRDDYVLMRPLLDNPNERVAVKITKVRTIGEHINPRDYFKLHNYKYGSEAAMTRRFNGLKKKGNKPAKVMIEFEYVPFDKYKEVVKDGLSGKLGRERARRIEIAELNKSYQLNASGMEEAAADMAAGHDARFMWQGKAKFPHSPSWQEPKVPSGIHADIDMYDAAVLDDIAQLGYVETPGLEQWVQLRTNPESGAIGAGLRRTQQGPDTSSMKMMWTSARSSPHISEELRLDWARQAEELVSSIYGHNLNMVTRQYAIANPDFIRKAGLDGQKNTWQLHSLIRGDHGKVSAKHLKVSPYNVLFAELPSHFQHKVLFQYLRDQGLNPNDWSAMLWGSVLDNADPQIRDLLEVYMQGNRLIMGHSNKRTPNVYQQAYKSEYLKYTGFTQEADDLVARNKFDTGEGMKVYHDIIRKGKGKLVPLSDPADRPPTRNWVMKLAQEESEALIRDSNNIILENTNEKTLQEMYQDTLRVWDTVPATGRPRGGVRHSGSHNTPTNRPPGMLDPDKRNWEFRGAPRLAGPHVGEFTAGENTMWNPRGMKVAIVGSRYGVTQEMVEAAANASGIPISVIISGTADGADVGGEKLAQKMGWGIKRYKEKWDPPPGMAEPDDIHWYSYSFMKGGKRVYEVAGIPIKWWQHLTGETEIDRMFQVIGHMNKVRKARARRTFTKMSFEGGGPREFENMPIISDLSFDSQRDKFLHLHKTKGHQADYIETGVQGAGVGASGRTLKESMSSPGERYIDAQDFFDESIDIDQLRDEYNAIVDMYDTGTDKGLVMPEPIGNWLKNTDENGLAAEFSGMHGGSAAEGKILEPDIPGGAPIIKIRQDGKRYNSKAGPERNAAMLEDADAVIAILPGGRDPKKHGFKKSFGTSNMIEQTKQAKKAIFVFDSDDFKNLGGVPKTHSAPMTGESFDYPFKQRRELELIESGAKTRFLSGNPSIAEVGDIFYFGKQKYIIMEKNVNSLSEFMSVKNPNMKEYGVSNAHELMEQLKALGFDIAGQHKHSVRKEAYAMTFADFKFRKAEDVVRVPGEVGEEYLAGGYRLDGRALPFRVDGNPLGWREFEGRTSPIQPDLPSLIHGDDELSRVAEEMSGTLKDSHGSQLDASTLRSKFKEAYHAKLGQYIKDDWGGMNKFAERFGLNLDGTYDEARELTMELLKNQYDALAAAPHLLLQRRLPQRKEFMAALKRIEAEDLESADYRDLKKLWNQVHQKGIDDISPLEEWRSQAFKQLRQRLGHMVNRAYRGDSPNLRYQREHHKWHAALMGAGSPEQFPAEAAMRPGNVTKNLAAIQKLVGWEKAPKGIDLSDWQAIIRHHAENVQETLFHPDDLWGPNLRGAARAAVDRKAGIDPALPEHILLGQPATLTHKKAEGVQWPTGKGAPDIGGEGPGATLTGAMATGRDPAQRMSTIGASPDFLSAEGKKIASQQEEWSEALDKGGMLLPSVRLKQTFDSANDRLTSHISKIAGLNPGGQEATMIAFRQKLREKMGWLRHKGKGVSSRWDAYNADDSFDSAIVDSVRDYVERETVWRDAGSKGKPPPLPMELLAEDAATQKRLIKLAQNQIHADYQFQAPVATRTGKTREGSMFDMDPNAPLLMYDNQILPSDAELGAFKKEVNINQYPDIDEFMSENQLQNTNWAEGMPLAEFLSRRSGLSSYMHPHTGELIEVLPDVGDMTELLERHGLGNHVIDPTGVKAMAEMQNTIGTPQEYHQLYRKIARGNAFIKGSLTQFFPAFYVRNLFSDTILSWMSGGFNPANSYDAWAIAWNFEEELTQLPEHFKKRFGNARQIADEMKAVGLFRGGKSSQFLRELSGTDITDTGFKEVYDRITKAAPGLVKDDSSPMYKKLVSLKWLISRGLPEKYKNKIMDMGYGEIAQLTERYTRAQHVLTRMQKGDSFIEATRHAKEYLLDYDDLTRFERSVASNALLFYSWTRKIIPILMKNFLERPGRVAAISRLSFAPSQRRDDIVPPWIKQTSSIPVGDGYVWGIGSPLEELFKLEPMTQTGELEISQILKKFGSQATPFLKMPLETMFGMDIFKNRRLNELQTLGPEHWLLKKMGFPITEKTTPSGAVIHTVSPTQRHWLAQPPWGRFLKDFGGGLADIVAEGLGGDLDPNKTWKDNLARLAIGAKYAPMDDMNKLWATQKYIENLLEDQIAGGDLGSYTGYFTHTGIAPEREEDLQRYIEMLREIRTLKQAAGARARGIQQPSQWV